MKFKKINAMSDCKCDFCNKPVMENEECFWFEYYNYDTQHYIFNRSCSRCQAYIQKYIESGFCESVMDIYPEAFFEFMDDFHRQVLDDWGMPDYQLFYQCCPT